MLAITDLIPAGKVPLIVHLYGVQPPAALIVVVDAVPTVPLGKVVVWRETTLAKDGKETRQREDQS